MLKYTRSEVVRDKVQPLRPGKYWHEVSLGPVLPVSVSIPKPLRRRYRKLYF